MIFSSQLRAARVLLGWRQEDISKASGVGIATIQRIEQRDGIAMANMRTLIKLQEALEKGGVRFIDEDDAGGYGVRLTTRSSRSGE